MIDKALLKERYLTQGKSVHDIATELNCSDNKITYWLNKHNLKKRTISEAIYIKNNPNGDPFTFMQPRTTEEWFLYGLGLGLFWGEGNKVNKHSIRLGNTDPDLILIFLNFLKKIYKINENKLSFGLQIFSDISKNTALDYWSKKIKCFKR